ncbi:Atrial natriuretic peptide clearance receptor [Plakobranchus ocellatus]|uniref:Atrial natriuretic peptide clearance receptor n=1 Tax=Plakobranchus ocellatus TaxID=259542 RepID=A0AAV4A379_9GAST|nr:Atrial natriuretic peptide clearance receptor [Plakobranchus ocellatus]
MDVFISTVKTKGHSCRHTILLSILVISTLASGVTVTCAESDLSTYGQTKPETRDKILDPERQFQKEPLHYKNEPSVTENWGIHVGASPYIDRKNSLAVKTKGFGAKRRRVRSNLSSLHQRRHRHKLPRFRRHPSSENGGGRLDERNAAHENFSPQSKTTHAPNKSSGKLTKNAKRISKQKETNKYDENNGRDYSFENKNTNNENVGLSGPTNVNNFVYYNGDDKNNFNAKQENYHFSMATENASETKNSNFSFRDLGKRSTSLLDPDNSKKDKNNTTNAIKRIPINVVVLLPEEEDRLFSIQRVRPAIKLATDNVTSSGILARHELVTSYADSKCHIAEAMNEAIKAVMRVTIPHGNDISSQLNFHT